MSHIKKLFGNTRRVLVRRTRLAYCFAIRPLRGVAARALAKNSPQDCFLYARAVPSSSLISKKLFGNTRRVLVRRTRLAYCFAIRPLRGIAARALAENSPQDCFLYARAVSSSSLISKNSSAIPEEFWCGGRDLNSYGVTHRLLRPARLPISPPPQT